MDEYIDAFVYAPETETVPEENNSAVRQEEAAAAVQRQQSREQQQQQYDDDDEGGFQQVRTEKPNMLIKGEGVIRKRAQF